jgi:HAD superfamily hydrolase (TIGR01509 family)
MTVFHRLTWNQRPLRGIIFDMDGVLADTRAAHTLAWGAFLERYGIQVDINQFINETFGQTNQMILSRFYPEEVKDPKFVHRMGMEKEDLFLDGFARSNTLPPPGLLAFLAKLKAHAIAISVGSSAPRQNIDAVIKAFGIEEYFSAIISSENVTRSKPDPEVFTKAAQAMNLPPEECVVFEDSIHGMESGRSAGCLVVGITTLHPAKELADYTDATLPNFEQVFEKLSWEE